MAQYVFVQCNSATVGTLEGDASVSLGPWNDRTMALICACVIDGDIAPSLVLSHKL